MDRRQLAFIILINAFVSLVIALAVVWIVDSRRPDLEALAAQYTPLPQAIIAATATPIDEIQSEPTTLDVAANTAAASEGETVIYIVQVGDILSSIAAQYGVPVDLLVETNGLADPNSIYSGQRLSIPADAATEVAVDTDGSAGSDARGNPQITALENPGEIESEAVLIVNESDVPVDLDGWKLQRENGPTYTFGTLPLFAGSSVRVYSTVGDDNSIARYWGEPEALWSSGAEALLVDETGEVVERYSVP